MEDDEPIKWKIFKQRAQLTRAQRNKWKKQRKQPFITLAEGEWYSKLLLEPNSHLKFIS